MASPTPFRRSVAVVVISALSLFACTGGTTATTSPEVIVLYDDYSYAAPPRPEPSYADFARHLQAFKEACYTPRFPPSLVAVPLEHPEFLADVGPGRCSMKPGHASCDRQSVPSRSRRKLRTWERDVA